MPRSRGAWPPNTAMAARPASAPIAFWCRARRRRVRREARRTASKLKVGRGVDPGVVIGPLIEEAAAEKVEHLVADARARGAQSADRRQRAMRSAEHLLADRALRRAPGHADFRRRIFGPVAAITPSADEEEAIASPIRRLRPRRLFLQPRHSARVRVAEQLEFGIVGVNSADVERGCAFRRCESSRAWDARAPNTASRAISRSNMSASAICEALSRRGSACRAHARRRDSLSNAA